MIDELQDTPEGEKKRLMFELLDPLPRLDYVDEVDSIVAIYFANKLMPIDSGGDAHHLALASFHRCDILATWNVQTHHEPEQSRSHPHGERIARLAHPHTHHPV